MAAFFVTSFSVADCLTNYADLSNLCADGLPGAFQGCLAKGGDFSTPEKLGHYLNCNEAAVSSEASCQCTAVGVYATCNRVPWRDLDFQACLSVGFVEYIEASPLFN